MKRKILSLAFMICLLSCGIILTACTQSPTLTFKDGETLSREYDGTAITSEDVLEIINVKEGETPTITLYQGETLIEEATNAGTYKAFVSIPSKTIEQEFTIAQRKLNNIVFTGFWRAGTGERTWTKALNSSNGVIGDDDVSVSAIAENFDINANIKSATLTGEDCANYTVDKADVKVDLALSIKITSSADSSKSVNVFVRYGDNNVYTTSFMTEKLTSAKLSTLGNVTKIYKEFDQTSNEVINLSADNFGTLFANAKYSSTGFFTDANGNWIVPNGTNAEAINLIAKIAE